MNSTNSPFEFRRKNRINEQLDQTIIVWSFFIIVDDNGIF